MPTGIKCNVSACENIYRKTMKDKTLRYHRWPKDESMRKVWMKCCGRNEKWNPQVVIVCSKHFKKEDYERDLKAELLGLPPKRHLRPTAVPSLYLKKEEHKKELQNTPKGMQKELDKEFFVMPILNDTGNFTANAATQTTFYEENYTELLKRITNLENIIEQYKDIVHEYQLKNELLENSVKASTANRNMTHLKSSTASQSNGKSKKRFHQFPTDAECDMSLAKQKKLLWNSQKISKGCELRYLCKGCYIVVPKLKKM